MYLHKDALTLLLTVEALLFTALSLGIGAARRELAQVQTWIPFILALAVALVITLVAIGAMSAWSEIYDAAAADPERTHLGLQGYALAVAIVAQPIFAFVLALFARKA